MERYSFSIDFGSDPKRTEELVKPVFAEIAALQASGPTEKQVTDARESFLRDYETNSQQNSYALSQVYQRYLNGEDVNGWFRLPEEYKKIDAAMIHRAAREYPEDRQPRAGDTASREVTWSGLGAAAWVAAAGIEAS